MEVCVFRHGRGLGGALREQAHWCLSSFAPPHTPTEGTESKSQGEPKKDGEMCYGVTAKYIEEQSDLRSALPFVLPCKRVNAMFSLQFLVGYCGVVSGWRGRWWSLN